MEKKMCLKCRKVKDLHTEFRRDRQKKDGRYPRCKECEAEYFRVYDRSPRGRRRFERRKTLEDSIIQSPEAYRDYVCDYFGGACAITGEAGKGIALDHVVPLSWGVYGNELGNLLPLTPSLNRSKRNRSLFDVVNGLDVMDKIRFYTEVLPFLARENDMSVNEYVAFYKTMEKSRYR